jgi:predicted P-loop ATPase
MTYPNELDAAAESLGVIIDAKSMFSSWRPKLILDGKKKPRPVLANAATALREAPEWKGVLGYDEFADQTMMLQPAPWIEERQDWQRRPWTDIDDIRATEWMQRNGIFIKDRDVAQAVQMVAAENTYNPPKDYLDGLSWVGESRLETLLPQIFGAEPTPYVVAALRCFLIGAVARVYEPGCKMDTMLVLEGPQGIRKSTAVRELFGDTNFTDDMSEFGTKDASITAGSAWCIEIAELSAMVGRRKENEVIKAFITRREDNFRPPYGRRNIKRRRHCVLVGTTNADDWMRDDTGGRRYWPIRCGEIDVELLKTNRDQIWAEAVALYRLGPNEGGAWWFTDEGLMEMTRAEQQARSAVDPWEQPVLDYVASKRETTGHEVLEGLAVSKRDQNTHALMRVAKILSQARWRKQRVWKKGHVWYAPDYQPPSSPGRGRWE